MTNTTSRAEGAEISLLDAQYQEILRPILSHVGMRRYLNADPIELDPSDYRAIINRAIEFDRATQQASAAPADLVAAVRMLVKAKGRFHTEQNYKTLADALAAHDAASAAPQAPAAGEVKPWEERLKESTAPRGYDTFFAMRDEIADLRAKLASERAAKEYEQRHAVESEKAVAQMQVELASAQKDAERLELMARDKCIIDHYPTADGKVRYALSWPYLYEEQADTYDTPREAIDAQLAIDAARAQLTNTTGG